MNLIISCVSNVEILYKSSIKNATVKENRSETLQKSVDYKANYVDFVQESVTFPFAAFCTAVMLPFIPFEIDRNEKRMVVIEFHYIFSKELRVLKTLIV